MKAICKVEYQFSMDIKLSLSLTFIKPNWIAGPLHAASAGFQHRLGIRYNKILDKSREKAMWISHHHI